MADNPLACGGLVTGGIGSIAVRAVAENPGTGLVGRVGTLAGQGRARDAGELVGIGPIGVIATNDAEAADRTATGLRGLRGQRAGARRARRYPTTCGCWRRASTWSQPRSTGSIHPPTFEPEMWREQLTTRCCAGGASLYASGIEPGFAADHLVLTLATQSKSIRHIHASEIALPLLLTRLPIYPRRNP